MKVVSSRGRIVITRERALELFTEGTAFTRERYPVRARAGGR